VRAGVLLPMAESDGPGRVPTWAEVLNFARTLEDGGLDSIWVYDHLLNHPGDGSTEGVLEAWTLLAALAAATDRVELGQLVTCISFRNPAILAKMAATVDEIGGGRVTLGLGAGWDDLEYRAFGLPADHRVDRFEEALRVVLPLLRGERLTVEGPYHRTRDAVLLPPPRRRIPVLIAADGPRMLRLTARHADAWNTAWYGAPDDGLRAKLAEFDRALEAEGRDPAQLRRTVGVSVVDPDANPPVVVDADEEPFAGSVDELAAALDGYAALGIDDLVLVFQPTTDRSVERFLQAQRLRSR
jgi:alkanesulfonate monooxygenase SsuD/methylene tetrahydromethanopterin reductase-like flavin-dependent oxidoreductase (luciferase family)